MLPNELNGAASPANCARKIAGPLTRLAMILSTLARGSSRAAGCKKGERDFRAPLRLSSPSERRVLEVEVLRVVLGDQRRLEDVVASDRNSFLEPERGQVHRHG